MTLHVVRHADAGQRSIWNGDDRFRPLSARGLAQATSLVDPIRADPPVRILSSPALRCVQTVTMLGAAIGLAVDLEIRLFEGTGRAAVAELLDELGGQPTVLSSHGDVVPHLLDELCERGMRPDRGLLWQKASRWSVEMSADGVPGTGRYTPPPDCD